DTRTSFQELRMTMTPAMVLAAWTTDRVPPRFAAGPVSMVQSPTNVALTQGRLLFGAELSAAGLRSAGVVGRPELGEGGFRTITVSSMSGRSSVPTIRSVAFSLSESLLISSMI